MISDNKLKQILALCESEYINSVRETVDALKKLEIAVKALDAYVDKKVSYEINGELVHKFVAREALTKIVEEK